MIRRVLLLVRKDLLRKRRAPLGIAVVLAFPIVFSALLALSFGGDEPRIPRIELLVEDRDGSLVSRLLLGAAGDGRVAELVTVRRVDEGGLRLIEGDRADALLRIPEAFGADLLAGKPVALELIRNPARGIKPEIAEQALRVLTEILSAAARLIPEALGEQAACLESGDCAPSQAEVTALAGEIYDTVQASGPWLSPPAIDLVTTSVGDDDEDRRSGSTGFSIFLFVLPGVSVWALFMIGDHGMRDVLAESALGTLRRQICGPLSVSEVVLGKAVLSAALAVIGLSILSAIGLIALDRPIDLPAFAALSAALIVAVTGFAAVIYGMARTERQGATFSSAALLLLAFLGGSFVPLDSMPTAARTMAPASPLYWATSGYQTLLRDGSGFSSVATHVGVLATLGVVLLFLGSRLLRRAILAGRTP